MPDIGWDEYVKWNKPLPPQGRKCEDCYFFEAAEFAYKDGFCCRFPPMGSNTDWAQVNRDYWCGEYRASE